MTRIDYPLRMSRLLYQLYEHRLHRQLRAGRMPEHVGLVLDGNRRYARKQGFPDPGRAYEMGAQKLDEVLLWCSELGFRCDALGLLDRKPETIAYRGLRDSRSG
jgi:undecaprenyl pyrophosphate synthase